MLPYGRSRWSVTQTPQLKILCGDPCIGGRLNGVFISQPISDGIRSLLNLPLLLHLLHLAPFSFYWQLSIVLYISKDLRIKGRTMPNSFNPCIKRKIRGDNMHSWTWPSIPPLTSSRHRHVNFYLKTSKCHHRHLAHLTRNILRRLFCMLCFLFRKEG